MPVEQKRDFLSNVNLIVKDLLTLALPIITCGTLDKLFTSVKLIFHICNRIVIETTSQICCETRRLYEERVNMYISILMLPIIWTGVFSAIISHQRYISETVPHNCVPTVCALTPLSRLNIQRH